MPWNVAHFDYMLAEKKMLKKFDYHFYLKKNKVSMYQGIESQKKLWNSRSFILLTRKNEEIQSRKIKKFNMLFWIFLLWISTFFLIHKIKDQEFQKYFSHSLSYSYTYPVSNHPLLLWPGLLCPEYPGYNSLYLARRP